MSSPFNDGHLIPLTPIIYYESDHNNRKFPLQINSAWFIICSFFKSSDFKDRYKDKDINRPKVNRYANNRMNRRNRAYF